MKFWPVPTLFTLGTKAFEELRLEFINFLNNCVNNSLILIVYLTGELFGFSI